MSQVLIPTSLSAEQIDQAAAAVYDGHYDRDPAPEGKAPVPRFDTLTPQIKSVWRGTAQGLLSWAAQNLGTPVSNTPETTGPDPARFEAVRAKISDLKKVIRYPSHAQKLEEIEHLLDLAVHGPPPIDTEATALPELP